MAEKKISNKKRNEEKTKAKQIKVESIKIFSKAMSSLSSNEKRLEIALIIKSEQKATFTEIKKKLNINNNNLRFHLKKLKEADIIYQLFNRGPYKVTDLGSTVLKFFEVLENESLKYNK